MSEIRIITLWQPYASLIALGLKKYETRSWSTPYRGKLAIHAAKRPFVSADGSKVLDEVADIVWLDALKLACDAGILTDQSRVPFAHQLPLGCIVAIADLIDCQEMVETTPLAPVVSRPIISIDQQTEIELAVGDWQSGRFAWKLENVVALPNPIPFKGAQGLRKLTDTSVLQAIATQQPGGVA